MDADILILGVRIALVKAKPVPHLIAIPIPPRLTARQWCLNFTRFLGE